MFKDGAINCGIDVIYYQKLSSEANETSIIFTKATIGISGNVTPGMH